MSDAYKILTALPGERETDALRFGNGGKNLLILPGLSLGSVLRSAPAVAVSYRGFSDAYTVTLFDRRKRLPEPYTVFDMAEDTAAAMDALGMETADVMGVSQGGMIALCMALSRPEKINRLALCSSAARVSPTAETVLAGWRKLAKEKRLGELSDDFAGKLFSPVFCEKYGDALRRMNGSLTDEDLRRFLILSDVGAGFDITGRLSEIACKTLVLGAEHDAVLGDAGEETARLLPDCESYFYPAPYGHGVYDEAPDFKKRILDYLLQK